MPTETLTTKGRRAAPMPSREPTAHTGENGRGCDLRTARAARAAVVVMMVVAAFQVALVFGAPWGAYTQGGETEGPETSWRVVAAILRAILLVMAVAILARVREVRSRAPRADS